MTMSATRKDSTQGFSLPSSSAQSSGSSSLLQAVVLSLDEARAARTMQVRAELEAGGQPRSVRVPLSVVSALPTSVGSGARHPGLPPTERPPSPLQLSRGGRSLLLWAQLAAMGRFFLESAMGRKKLESPRMPW